MKSALKHDREYVCYTVKQCEEVITLLEELRKSRLRIMLLEFSEKHNHKAHIQNITEIRKWQKSVRSRIERCEAKCKTNKYPHTKCTVCNILKAIEKENKVKK